MWRGDGGAEEGREEELSWYVKMNKNYKKPQKPLETDLVIRKASLDVLFLLRSSVDSLLSEEDCLTSHLKTADF